MQPDWHVRQPARVVGCLAKPCLGAGIGQDMGLFGDSDVGRDRNEWHPGDQATGDCKHGRRRGGGQHGDPLRPSEPFGHRGRRADQITARQGNVTDPDGVADIGPGRHRGRVQGGQQHLARLPRRPASRVADATGEVDRRLP